MCAYRDLCCGLLRSEFKNDRGLSERYKTVTRATCFKKGSEPTSGVPWSAIYVPIVLRNLPRESGPFRVRMCTVLQIY